ncbi:MAG: hypothetical protein Aurels2KO_16420 [Aureliella sp.]
MCHSIQLFPNGGVNHWVPMAMHVAPHAANRINQRSTVVIVKPNSFTAVDYQRFVLGHLRKRMPVVLAIYLQQRLKLAL